MLPTQQIPDARTRRLAGSWAPVAMALFLKALASPSYLEASGAGAAPCLPCAYMREGQGFRRPPPRCDAADGTAWRVGGRPSVRCGRAASRRSQAKFPAYHGASLGCVNYSVGNALAFPNIISQRRSVYAGPPLASSPKFSGRASLVGFSFRDIKSGNGVSPRSQAPAHRWGARWRAYIGPRL